LLLLFLLLCYYYYCVVVLLTISAHHRFLSFQATWANKDNQILPAKFWTHVLADVDRNVKEGRGNWLSRFEAEWQYKKAEREEHRLQAIANSSHVAPLPSTNPSRKVRQNEETVEDVERKLERLRMSNIGPTVGQVDSLNRRKEELLRKQAQAKEDLGQRQTKTRINGCDSKNSTKTSLKSSPIQQAIKPAIKQRDARSAIPPQPNASRSLPLMTAQPSVLPTITNPDLRSAISPPQGGRPNPYQQHSQPQQALGPNISSRDPYSAIPSPYSQQQRLSKSQPTTKSNSQLSPVVPQYALYTDTTETYGNFSPQIYDQKAVEASIKQVDGRKDFCGSQ
jgi:hypothetical protein